jgi:DMSO reductase anchor subunit
MRWLLKMLFGHPAVKGVIFSAINIATAVMGGAFVLEITRTAANGQQILDWHHSYQSPSFWWLVGLVVLMGLYSWRVARHEAMAQYEAEQREQAFRVLGPAYIEHFRREIEAGNLTPMSEVMRMLGINGGGER